MPHGQTSMLAPNNEAIWTQRASEILGMSRPFFIKQLEGDSMVHRRTRNQRRVHLGDVLEFAMKRGPEGLSALETPARSVWKLACTSRMHSGRRQGRVKGDRPVVWDVCVLIPIPFAETPDFTSNTGLCS